MIKFISVVIPAHNRPDFLAKTLERLLKQNYPKEKYEIIVVGYKEDNTLDIVKRKFSDKRLRFFTIDSRFPDKKRNFGIKQAKGSVIAFTDDDCLPEKDWLKNINEVFERDKELAGAEGLTWNDNKKLYCHATENLSGGKYPACNYAFKKSVLLDVHGFDENYNFFREDTDLAFKVLSKGFKVVFDKNVRVYHPPRKKPLSFPIKELFLVKGDIRLFKKFPELYRKHFGFVCRGSFKLSAFAWFVLALIASSLLFELHALVPLLIALIFLFKFLVEMRGKQFNVIECLAFVFFSYLRDLLFPFFFVYYWFKIRV
jgi:glycosyltransferase involved in cell wall biosynthesis